MFICTLPCLTINYNKTILKIELARVLAAPPIAIRAELLKAWLHG